ncbi:MAG: SUMF1/EgtB/PvdO family nonheme iron enzyme [Deltaproteobacteria bacterium]|nr:SUMF1/EgtB/PvdO family nonheme iron enzyme [Deltaproteobacteria bacterium]
MADPKNTGEPTSSSEDPFDLCGVAIDDKYRVDTLVGRGGFGVVYRGVHIGFDEPIAVKCLKLPGELTERERDELLSRLKDEGRVLHRLSKLSSGIVQALDVGAMTTPNDQWVPYLILEWLEGETLAEYIRSRKDRGEGAHSLDEALELMEPAARALAVAHQQKVAHRDVKPENIYLTEVSGQRTLKVLDFGIAKVLTQHATFTAAPAATAKQASAFTPSYGAPEQFNKKRGATGPWTDVFALALILVELVSGERALDGDDATQLYISAADPASRPTLRYHGVETSNAVEDVFRRALAIEPGDRYQDAGAFWDALSAAAGQKPRVDPAQTDVSETGEFISHHDISLEPEDLSDAVIPPVKDEAEGLPSTKRERSARPPAPAARGRASSRSGKGDGRGLLDETAVTPETTVTTDPPASSRWVPVVVLLALAGAALLYLQLREIGLSEVDDRHTDSQRSAAPTTPTSPVPSSVRSGMPLVRDGGVGGTSMADGAVDGPDAEPLDAALDGAGGGGGAGGANPAVEPPEGMVLIAAGDGDAGAAGFFIDRVEVSTKDYQECVAAGRCVRATRVVLDELSAAALGVEGVDSTTTPEQLAAAWGKRCNATRAALDHPVNCVNHGSADDYCRYRSKRLPTSTEWTLAAGGPDRRFPWGDTQPECTTACYGLNGSCVGIASKVASCPGGARSGDITPEGVVDLAGNLAEWVADPAPDKATGGQPWHLLRGGSFTDEASRLVVATKRAIPAVTAHVTVGFRCALDLP